jgi:uncharacterized phage-associated protein
MPRTENFDKLKDQFALWLLLCKLKELGFQTKRLKLQKLVYLMDVFGTILNKKPTTYTFRVYKFGPFSKEIYSDIERLVSIDAVKAKGFEAWDPDRDRSFEYEIECEQEKISTSQLILRRPEFDTVRKTVELVVQTAGFMSGVEIRKLVYCEPNFLKAKSEGFGSTISSNYSFAARFREMSKKISSEEFGIELTDEEVLWLYLNLMKSMETKGMQLHNE